MKRGLVQQTLLRRTWPSRTLKRLSVASNRVVLVGTQQQRFMGCANQSLVSQPPQASTTQTRGYTGSRGGSPSSLLAFGAAVMAAGATWWNHEHRSNDQPRYNVSFCFNSSTTLCEAAVEVEKDTDLGNLPARDKEQQEEEEEQDPYDNLPEEDAPTDCSMCNTFRQGPCGPFWRKLERCFKDHENTDENVGVKCLKYFTPHQTCLSQYINLYLLIGHEMKQSIVEDAEKAFSKPEERHELTMPNVDWTLWKSFLKEQGASFRQTIPDSSPDTPLWKRLPEGTEPVLITLQTHLPHQCPARDNLILKVAFVLDQDSKVLGYVYNDMYSDLLKESNGEEVPEKEKTPLTDTVKMEFCVMPGETRRIQIKAYYTENPVEADPKKEILDGLLCGTKLVSVPDDAT